MRVIIVEDEGPAMLRMSKLIEKASISMEVLARAETGKRAIELINLNHPSLIFLDIQLPDMSGFEVLKGLVYKPLVIFTTAYSEYAIAAFEHLTIDYLLKPVTLEKLNASLEKINDLHHNNTVSEVDFYRIEELINTLNKPIKSTLTIKDRDKIKLIQLSEISHIEAADKYVYVHTKSGNKHLLSKSLSQLVIELPSNFIRVHKSYLINKEMVVEMEKYFKGRYILKMNDATNSKIQSGESFLPSIKKAFNI